MTTNKTLTETAKLFRPDHTAVIFCPNPKLPQTLFWEMVDPMKNVKWCETIPDSENDDIIKDMELCIDGHETEWFLLNLERVSPYFERLSNYIKFAELMLKVDEFVKTHHLKMLVSFAFTNPEFSLVAAQMLESYVTQKHHSMSIMIMTDKAPITLTVGTDEDNRETIGYEINDKGHLIEK